MAPGNAVSGRLSPDMTAKPPLEPSKWDDLKTRVISGASMLVVGAFAIVMGGIWFQILVIVVTAAMLWELWVMFSSLRAKASPLATSEQVRFLAYGLGVLIAGWGLIYLRNVIGLSVLVWLISVVVVTDIAGYFAGRVIGGAKFWPSVSPKKTWSGVIAGWVASAIIGLIFLSSTGAGLWIVLVSVLLSFSSQLGDIAESALKRKAGVKDSSTLIPGHGGVLDRFDGVLGATLLLLVLSGALF